MVFYMFTSIKINVDFKFLFKTTYLIQINFILGDCTDDEI